jgi:transcriptional regulator
VPTWNYVSVELEGRVRRMDSDGLIALLEVLTERHEAAAGDGERWAMDRVPPDALRRMLAGIIGFEMEIQARRPTFKLSQNKPAETRRRVSDGLESAGSAAMAELMRRLAP